MEEKPNYYAIIPANVRYDNEITDKAKLLYGEITSLSSKNGECWASNKYFADLYNVSIITISRLITSLEKKGYVSRKIIYKDDSKEIEKRIIIPIVENVNTYYQKSQEGYYQKNQEGIIKNVKDNNTSINNTSINNNTTTTEILKSDTLFDLIEQNFGRTLNPIEYEKITEWKDNELTRYAIKKAILSNKYNINYIDRTLLNWEKEGIKTVVQAQESTDNFIKRQKDTHKKEYKTASERFEDVLNRFAEGEE